MKFNITISRSDDAQLLSDLKFFADSISQARNFFIDGDGMDRPHCRKGKTEWDTVCYIAFDKGAEFTIKQLEAARDSIRRVYSRILIMRNKHQIWKADEAKPEEERMHSRLMVDQFDAYTENLDRCLDFLNGLISRLNRAQMALDAIEIEA